MKISIAIAIVCSLFLTGGEAVAAENGHKKISPLIVDGIVGLSEGFIVLLTTNGDISRAHQFRSKTARGNFVYETKRTVAEASQAAIVDILGEMGVAHRRFWIVNGIWVRGDLALAKVLAARKDVARIIPNPGIKNTIAKPARKSESDSSRSLGTVAWGVAKVGADEVWKHGITGEGAVVAGADTGYSWQHPALIQKYRGYTGKNANHDYNWHDAIHQDGGDCPGDSLEPCDDFGHGTHTMGIMVGDDGVKHQIGMAPGAEWIGCRNMQEGVGTPARYIECYEFFLAPYPTGGDPLKDGDPKYAPDVISNSWICPAFEGCDADTLLEVVDTIRAAGIVDVVSAGNAGPECFTIVDPPAIYESTFTVGATNQNDWNIEASGLGPVSVDGSNRLKPDIAAPGENIPSSVIGDGYIMMSGTSMASPHVSGMVALLVSADPTLRGDVNAIEEIIRYSALPRTSPIICGDYDAEVYPNPIYGYGRIDVPEALVYMGYFDDPTDGGVDTDTGSESDTESVTEDDTETGTSTDDPDAGHNPDETNPGGCGCGMQAMDSPSMLTWLGILIRLV